jgi:histidine ammonia-lyase
MLSRADVEMADVVAVARDGERLRFASVIDRDLAASRAIVESALADGNSVYGLNTELGAGRDVTVDPERIEAFQRRTIRNSNAGLGEPLTFEQARAVIFARLVGFTRGGSGVTPELAGRYRELLNRDVFPLIPRVGSVGAADLTHLSAIAAVVIGEGRAFVDGSVVPGAVALESAGLAPFALGPGEGLAVLSSNAYSVGVGCLVVSDLAAIVNAADRVLALSLTAARAASTGGNRSPFSAEIQSAHRSIGQAASAARVRALLGSVGAEERETPGSVSAAVSVQDPVSFRSAPQVHGAFAEAVTAGAAALRLELNSRTENPLVDVESGRMISGGNFQVLSLALSFEQLRLALAHVAVISERRIARLSTLAAPSRRAGLTRVPGILWYSASALVSEARHLATPVTLSAASLDDSVEDYSSNAAVALQLLERSAAIVRTVLAVEATLAAELILFGRDGTVPTAALTEPLASLLDVVSSGLDAAAAADELLVGVERELY